MPRDLAQQRRAIFAIFFIPGLLIASWVTRIPDIRDLLAASTADMGAVLFGLSGGSMLGILSAGPLVARLGTRPVILTGVALILLSMPTVGLGAAQSSNVIAAGGLFLFGLGMGGAEIALNVVGADLEAQIGIPVLPALHGFFSLGTLVGAVAGIAFTATDFPVVWHLTLVAAVSLVVALFAAGHVASDIGRVPGRREKSRVSSPVWRDPALLIIGTIVLAMALAEGSANDWLPLVMVDGHGFDEALGSAIYAVFAASMAAGRFAGGWFVAKFGRSRVLSVSALLGVIGLGLVVIAETQVLAGAAVVFWGLGASLGFPLAISAAGDSEHDPAGRVALVSTIGYCAFLVGPPVLGFIGDEHGLRSVLLIPLIFMVLAFICSQALMKRGRGQFRVAEEGASTTRCEGPQKQWPTEVASGGGPWGYDRKTDR